MTSILDGSLRLLFVVAALAEPDAMPRVRSSHPYIRAMVSEAQVRSATFRRLIAAIEATNGIVYVEEGECGHSSRSCLPLTITSVGGFRILRVVVDARQRDWDVMSSIGHELQHALEVLNEPAVTTDEAVYFLFSRQHAWTGDAFETQEALKVGATIRNDIVSFARNASSRRAPRPN